MTIENTQNLIAEFVQLKTVLIEKAENSLKADAQKLQASTSSVVLKNVDISALPNTRELLAGTQSAIKARMSLGAKKSDQMDPNQQSLKSIQTIAQNGVNYFDELKKQEKIIKNILSKVTVFAEQGIERSIAHYSRILLTCDRMPGFEANLTTALPATVQYPSTLQGTGLQTLDAARLTNFIQQIPGLLQINRLLNKALENGTGIIKVMLVQ
jgi:hypothetical protein